MRILALCVVAAIALSSAPAFAEEPVGCDKFKWPLEKEMAALRAPDLKTVAAGTKVAAVPFAGKLVLAPSGSANLPKAPERAPKDGTFSGYLSFAPVAEATYTISLSEGAWVDVVQGERFLKSKAHSGAQGCPGIRKVVQFDLSKEPFVIQVSGAAADQIAIAVMPAGE